MMSRTPALIRFVLEICSDLRCNYDVVDLNAMEGRSFDRRDRQTARKRLKSLVAHIADANKSDKMDENSGPETYTRD